MQCFHSDDFRQDVTIIGKIQKEDAFATMTTITYSSYLRVEELLALQHPQSDGPEHDEMLFIVTQQVYELWFRQILYELDSTSAAFAAHDTAQVLHTLKRILKIVKVMTHQVDVLETMTPLGFNAFRDRLETSSGFQSAQFRELEFALGYKRPTLMAQYPEDSPMFIRLADRLAKPGLWDAFLHYLAASGFAVPADLLNRDITTPCPPSPEVQQTLLTVYQTDLMLTEMCEGLIDLDEGLQEWRYRHLKLTERTIGTKSGTGSSAGVEYLRATLTRSFFPDLWALRGLM